MTNRIYAPRVQGVLNSRAAERRKMFRNYKELNGWDKSEKTFFKMDCFFIGRLQRQDFL